MKTNLGRKLLYIVDQCLPKRHPLHKIFNRHNLKLSYSCMPNIKSIIASPYTTILSNYTSTPGTEQNDTTCANLPQWAFLHWWRAVPETSVHFLMFNDTSKSFPLPFSCFYSATHCFPIFRFLQLIVQAYPRRLESLTIRWCNCKGSTFYSVFLRPWVKFRSESHSRPPAWQPNAELTESPVQLPRNQQYVTRNNTLKWR